MATPKLNVQKIDTFSGHRDCVYTLEKAESPQTFFSTGADGLVVKWDLSRPDFGDVVARVAGSVYALAYDSMRGQLWLGQNFEGIQVVDLATKQIVNSSKITNASIFDIQFFENQAFVALSDGVLIAMDVPHFAVRKHLKAANQSARCVAVCPQTREVAVGYSDHLIRIFGIDDLALRHTLNAHSNSVFTLKYSPDGRFLLSGGRDAHLKVWEVVNDYALHKDIAAHLFAINHLIYSPDHVWFATCSMDKSIKIWDAATFQLLKVIDRARHAGHGTSVNKLLWTSFQQQLLSCSDDRLVSVWSVERPSV